MQLQQQEQQEGHGDPLQQCPADGSSQAIGSDGSSCSSGSTAYSSEMLDVRCLLSGDAR
jgi:hypothetical protein